MASFDGESHISAVATRLIYRASLETSDVQQAYRTMCSCYAGPQVSHRWGGCGALAAYIASWDVQAHHVAADLKVVAAGARPCAMLGAASASPACITWRRHQQSRVSAAWERGPAQRSAGRCARESGRP